MDIATEIKKLELPQNSYVVVGSGILNALKIRPSNDIDLIVRGDVFATFEKQGWSHDKWGDQTVLKQGVFDIGTSWFGLSVDDLLKRAQIVDGIPYLSLDDVYEWKKSMGRDKDLADLKLIDNYRKRN